ncbi:MAG TPA: hypothetical protein ENN09_01585 [Planctomycetes bacterium]|nr:hypothetical protein [Planctomycetota bacterium]
MNARRVCVSAALFLFLPVFAAGAFEFVPGVKEPTPEETAAFKRIATSIVQVRTNALGRHRLNAARAAVIGKGGIVPGRTLTEADDVPFSHEIAGLPALLADAAASEPVKMVSAQGEPVVGALPGQVDNSLLDWFPPIGSQSGGSCASFSTTYYQFTHMTAMARGWNAKTGGNGYRLSASWTYPLVNGGNDAGSTMFAPLSVLLSHGAATLSEWPQTGAFRAWCLNGGTWRNALCRRAAATGTISGLDTDEGMNVLKILLVNGYVLTFATYVNSWEQKTIPDDPATTDDDPWVGQKICRYQNGYNGPHGMTIVGYNDYIWCDVNENGVVDAGEKGALKIANSWGTGDWNSGFRWISYDALKRNSAVAGGPTANRAGAFTSAYWLTARQAYAPEMVGVFTVHHPKRNQMRMYVGKSATDKSAPQQTFTGNALSYNGGAYAFDGTSTPCDGIFALDFTDITPDDDVQMRYYCSMTDSAGGAEEGIIKAFELQNAAGAVLASYSGPEVSVANGTTEHVYIDLTYDRGAAATVTVEATEATASEAGPVNGRFRITRTGSTAAALSVNFTVAGSAEISKDYVLKNGSACIQNAALVPAGAAFVEIDVAPVDDWLVEGTETVELSLKSGSGYAVGAPDKAVVSILDDDVIQIRTDRDPPTGGSTWMYVPENGSAEFRVKLTAAPASPLSVSTARTYGDTDITVTGGALLVFDAGNWNTWQTVTLSAADDADTFGGGATVTCSAAGVSSKSINVYEIDDDACNIVADVYAVDVPEGGTAQFNIRCTMPPPEAFDVAVEWESGDQDISVVSGSTLSFSPSDWASWKTVALAAADDLDGWNGTAVIAIRPSLGSIGGVWSIIANEVDNDAAGPGILTSVSSVTVVECSTATFQVRLSCAPASPVTVSVFRSSGDSDIIVESGDSLDFDAGNWCQYQAVTLSALQDADALNGTATIKCLIPGVAEAEVTAKEMDIDAVQIVTDVWSVIVPENGTAEFRVKLASEPPGLLTLTVSRYSGDADISVLSGGILVFAPSDWHTWQTVTLAAADDADTTNGFAQFKITGEGVMDGWMAAEEADDDAVNIIVAPTRLEVPENGSAAFQVKLSMLPAEDTTVTVTVSGDADITVSDGASLLFTASDWMNWKSVTIAAADDADAVNGSASARVEASGLQSRFVQLSEIDDDIVDVVTDVSEITVPESHYAVFRVMLSGAPVAETTLSVNRSSGDSDLEVTSGASLVFNAANWNAWQDVTISAAEDADGSNGWAWFACSGVGVNQALVRAVELDNDGPNTPPIAVIDASPTSGTAPLAVFFDASASSDPGGAIVLYEYDFDYDGVAFNVEDSGASRTSTSHVYDTPGTYVAAVRVTDHAVPGLQDVDTIVIQVDAPDTTPPGVSVSAVLLAGEATDDSGAVVLEIDGVSVSVVGDAFIHEAGIGALPRTVVIVAEDSAANVTTVHLKLE